MSDKKQNPNRRFIGKVKQQQGQFGTFLKLLVDNPKPTTLDKSTGTEVQDQYNKGMLLWFDNENQRYYLIKQLSVFGVDDRSRGRGFTNSIAVDLDDEYQVEPVE